jgi:NTP pyrophosphatase (non-canonical NTP hydrolase)
MLTFQFAVELTTMLPCDPSTSKPLEPFTGIIEAENYDAAKQKAWTPIVARKKQIEAERGIMVGVGRVELVCQTVSTQDTPVMTPLAYQQCALRTLYPDLTTDKRLGLCGLGLPGEVGEVVDLIKKFLYHRNGKPLDTEKLKDELGDMLWYYFVLLDTIGITFEDVMMANVAKLEARHGNGFNPHYASDSHASEVER